MVTEECVRAMYTFVTAVNPELNDEIVKNIKNTTIEFKCRGQFKEIYIDDGIKSYSPAVVNIFKDLIDHPEYIRPDSYIEFGNNIFIEADGEKVKDSVVRLTHSVITSTPDTPLKPSCGRIDTDEDVKDVVQYKLNTTPEQCLTYLKDVNHITHTE